MSLAPTEDSPCTMQGPAQIIQAWLINERYKDVAKIFGGQNVHLLFIFNSIKLKRQYTNETKIKYCLECLFTKNLSCQQDFIHTKVIELSDKTGGAGM